MANFQVCLILGIFSLLSTHALDADEVLKAVPATQDDALGSGGYLIQLIDPVQAKEEYRYGNGGGWYPSGGGGWNHGGGNNGGGSGGGWYPSGGSGGWRPPHGGGGDNRYPCGRGRPCYRVMQESGGPNNEVDLWYNDQY